MVTAEHDDAPPAFRLQAKPRTFKTPASIINESEMLEIILEMSGYQAWRCGCANAGMVQTKGNFHKDHLNLVSKAGASRRITNRALLCPCHYPMKSNRGLAGRLSQSHRAERRHGGGRCLATY